MTRPLRAARPLVQRMALLLESTTTRGQSRLPTTSACRRLVSTSTSATVTAQSFLGTTGPSRPQLRAKQAAVAASPAQQWRCASNKTVEQAKSRYRTGPFSWKAGLLFVLTSGGLVWYFEHEKERMHQKRVAEATKGVGRPKVGGDFELVDQDGKPFSNADMLGRYSLVSLPVAFIWESYAAECGDGLGRARASVI